jgi:ribosome-associated toxin RatA of RatAB toxin-antitoxin module
MYDLVRDVERYPEFLPWCRNARILSNEDKEVTASIELAYHGIHKTFTTRNQYDPPSHLTMRLVEGPFRHLDGFWQFTALGDVGCKVSLDMDFEVAGRLVSKVLGPVFEQIANTLVEAFSKRAVEVYGKR